MGPGQPRKPRSPARRRAAPRPRGEGLYRRLVETIEERYLVYTHSVDGVFTYVSSGITRLLGYTPEEFSTHYTRYLTDHPVNREAMRSTDLSIRGERQPPYEVEIFHKDGSRRWLEVVETPVVDERGRVEAVHGLARDISDLKRAEAALRASERRYRRLFDAATDAIFVADAASGRLLDANPMAEALLGRDLAEIRGLHQSQLHPPEQLEKALHAFEQSGARSDLIEIDVLDRAGRRIPVEIAPSTLEEEGGARLVAGVDGQAVDGDGQGAEAQALLSLAAVLGHELAGQVPLAAAGQADQMDGAGAFQPAQQLIPQRIDEEGQGVAGGGVVDEDVEVVGGVVGAVDVDQA